MQISGFDAVARNWIENSKPNHVRHASYDLSVDKIIVDGKEVKPSWSSNRIDIEPQEVFVILSKERVRIPNKGITCYAFPKTSLCKQGVLALNTGIVDPGYDGLISTTAINFHSNRLSLFVGDTFLRLVFFEIAGDHTSNPAVVDPNTYLEERIHESAELPTSFLDVPGTVEKLHRQLRDEHFQFSIGKFGAILGGAALLLTICLSLLPVITPRVMESLGYVKNADVERTREFDQLNRAIENLSLEIEALREASKTKEP